MKGSVEEQLLRWCHIARFNIRSCPLTGRTASPRRDPVTSVNGQGEPGGVGLGSHLVTVILYRPNLCIAYGQAGFLLPVFCCVMHFRKVDNKHGVKAGKPKHNVFCSVCWRSDTGPFKCVKLKTWISVQWGFLVPRTWLPQTPVPSSVKLEFHSHLLEKINGVYKAFSSVPGTW